MDKFLIKKIQVVRENTDEDNLETEKLIIFCKCIVKF
jgi:hypothetical protein